jgi:hypothetical protein
MQRPFAIVLLALATTVNAASQKVSRTTLRPVPAPAYQISFGRGEAIPSVVASRSIGALFDCTSDGTVFVNMVLQPSMMSPPTDVLVSVSPSHESHEFRLDQLTDLYDLQQKNYYSSDNEVAFLVIAASENKQGKESFIDNEGVKQEVVHNLAARHDYLVTFDRTGSYKRKVQLDATMAISRVGIFPSGTILAFGFDLQDHSPKLALFSDSGSFIRFLEIPKGNAPKSMLGTQDDKGKGPAIYVAPSQLVPHGDFIIVVQNRSTFPLLEVGETGAIRKIKPRLPKDIRIDTLIPSDQLLYARVSDPQYPIYELNGGDGAISRRFHIGPHPSPDAIACVHDGKFLSFEHEDGKLVPLTGTAEPIAGSAPSDREQ